MKTGKLIAKIAVAIAAIAGAVYIVATYGDKIVAWCKKTLASLPCPCKEAEEACVCEAEEVVAEEVVAEEPAVEEAAAEEAVVEEVVAEEVAAEEPAAEDAVAEEADFEN